MANIIAILSTQNAFFFPTFMMHSLPISLLVFTLGVYFS